MECLHSPSGAHDPSVFVYDDGDGFVAQVECRRCFGVLWRGAHRLTPDLAGRDGEARLSVMYRDEAAAAREP